MTEDSRPAWWDVVRTWAPVVLVALLNQSGVGAANPWMGSSNVVRAVASMLLALPLALLPTRPLLATVLVSGGVLAQMPLGDSLSFGAFVAVLIAAYGLARHETSLTKAGSALGILFVAAVTASVLVEGEFDAEVVIPAIYLSLAFGLGRLVRHLASQAHQLRGLNASLEREREQDAALAVATERLRIARELHDVVAHRLMLMVIQAEAATEVLDSDAPAARRSLDRIQEAGRQGLDDLRGVVRVLRADPDGVGPPGLGDLSALVAVLSEARLDVELDRHGDASAVPAPLQETTFRVVQESLTNVLKHSAAGRAHVLVRCPTMTVTDLVIEVTDPGPSVTPAVGGTPDRASGGDVRESSRTSGQGLNGMAERLAAHGGLLEAGPHAEGFRVRATVPLKGAS